MIPGPMGRLLKATKFSTMTFSIATVSIMTLSNKNVTVRITLSKVAAC